MTFKLNNNKVSRRRYGSSTSFSVSSGPNNSEPAWNNTGAGGALNFYGNTDSYVRYENNGQFNLTANGNFTIEWWQYETDTNGAPRPWAFGAWPDTQLGVSFENEIYIWGRGDVLASFPYQKEVKNKRNHFALVWYVGICTMYQNGNFVGSFNDALPYNLTADLTIGYEGGAFDSQCFAGTITNFNIVKRAKYTDNFVPTTTALSIENDTLLLVPSTTQSLWVEPYGDYVGTVTPGSNLEWEQTSPFTTPAPNPLVTFPYPAATTTTTTYGPRTFLVSEYGSDAAAQAAANAACSQPVYGGWNGDIGSHYYASNCATVTTSYTCPDGGGYDGSGNCVQQYPATATTQLVNTGVLAPSDYIVACPWGGGYSENWINYWNARIAEGQLWAIAPYPLGSTCPDAAGMARYYAEYQTVYSCPNGGTSNGSGSCVF